MSAAETDPTEIAEAQASLSDLGATSNEDVAQRIHQTLDLVTDATNAVLGVHTLSECNLTVIVPVCNQRTSLPVVLERLADVMPPKTEVIVVDDGSIDGTSEWLENLAPRDGLKVIRRRGQHGRGSAIRLAIRHSHGDIVAIQDADPGQDPANLLRVIWPLLEGKADVAYGLESQEDRSTLHRFGDHTATKLGNFLTGLKLTELESCHKAFDGQLIRSIPLRECEQGFESEVTAKVASRGAWVMEVPTGENRKTGDLRKHHWRDTVASLARIWKYRGE